MGLRGLYQESVAEDERALEKVLREYQDVLAEDPVNIVGTIFGRAESSDLGKGHQKAKNCSSEESFEIT